jgi:hypothetical protein
LSEHVKISIGSCSVAGKIEAEFDAPDEVVKILKQIIFQRELKGIYTLKDILLNIEMNMEKIEELATEDDIRENQDEIDKLGDEIEYDITIIGKILNNEYIIKLSNDFNTASVDFANGGYGNGCYRRDEFLKDGKDILRELKYLILQSKGEKREW